MYLQMVMPRPPVTDTKPDVAIKTIITHLNGAGNSQEFLGNPGGIRDTIFGRCELKSVLNVQAIVAPQEQSFRYYQLDDHVGSRRKHGGCRAEMEGVHQRHPCLGVGTDCRTG